MHGDPTVHLCTPNSSFIQLKLLSHHWEHNIQRFLGSPQNIQKRSLKLRNTHFKKKMCIVHSLVLWKVGGKGGNYAILSSMEYRWPEGAFTMPRAEREGSWAAGVQLKCGICQPIGVFLRMCLGQWWIINMLHTGGGLSKKTSFRTFRGLWVKAEKWRGCQTAQKEEGERGWKCRTEGKKRLLIQKN